MGNVLQHANEITPYIIANLPLRGERSCGNLSLWTCETVAPRRESRREWTWRQCPEKTRQQKRLRLPEVSQLCFPGYSARC